MLQTIEWKRRNWTRLDARTNIMTAAELCDQCGGAIGIDCKCRGGRR